MPQRQLSTPEFIAMMALIMSVVAFSTDAMLPAFPQIGAELTPQAPERTALIVAVFMMGMGLGTFFTGPLSDAVGRKPVMTGGFALYALGSALSWIAPSFTLLLLGRALQGLGAAAPRVVAAAVIRDLHEGRRMAQITSFIMTVFMIVPAMAPSLGQAIIALLGWRALFGVFVVLAVVGSLWLNLRQPETLAPERRRPFTLRQFAAGLRELAGHRMVMLYTLVLTLAFSQLLTVISTIQPVYDRFFGVNAAFPLLFMASALISATGSLVNAWAVTRIGMRTLVRLAFLLQTLAALAYLASLPFTGGEGWAGVTLFFLWSTALFYLNGMTFGNLNAMALQPLGHMAGMAASTITALSTVGSAVVAGVVGVLTTGSPMPLALESAVCAGLALVLMTLAGPGKGAPQPRR